MSMTSNHRPALLDVCGPVATLTLDDPTRLNPLTEALLGACLEALAETRTNRQIRVLVLRANGSGFSAGANLLDLDPAEPATSAASVGTRVDLLLRDFGHRWVREIRALHCPVLAEVHGVVAGGGVGFALAADLIVAARSSYFYLPFAPALGLVPDMGAAWFLPRAIGAQRAMAMALLGEKVSAQDAERWGLIYKCVEDDLLADEAGALAARLAALPAHSITEVRRMMDHSRADALPEFLEYERARQRELIEDPCFAEGVAAFRQRRQPVFPGRG